MALLFIQGIDIAGVIVHLQRDAQDITSIHTRLPNTIGQVVVTTNITTGVDLILLITVMTTTNLVRDSLLGTGQIALALRVTRGEVTRLLHVEDIHVLRLGITTIILCDVATLPLSHHHQQRKLKRNQPYHRMTLSSYREIEYPNNEKPAPPVNDIALRIARVIKGGLPETEVKALREKYFTPSNSKFIDLPKLNEELRVFKLVRDDVALDRDKRIEGNQLKTSTPFGFLLRILSSIQLCIQK